MSINTPAFDNIDFEEIFPVTAVRPELLHFINKIHLADLLPEIPFIDTRHLPLYSNTDILNQPIVRTLLGYFNQSDQKILNEDPLLS